MTDYTDCMSRELKGKLAGKTKAKREALFKAAAKKCSKGSKSKAKSTPKPKSKPKERTRTTTKKNDKPKRRRGPLERKASDFKKELADIARGLGVTVSKATIKVGKTSTTVRVGSIIRVKRAKLSEAMKVVRKRAKARI